MTSPSRRRRPSPARARLSLIGGLLLLAGCETLPEGWEAPPEWATEAGAESPAPEADLPGDDGPGLVAAKPTAPPAPTIEPADAILEGTY